MTEHTIDINGKRYELNDSFKESLQRRARGEYRGNEMFSCWWKAEDGDPILVIETEGVMVPWDNLDQLEVEMQDISQQPDNDDDEVRDIDSGNGMKTVPPEDVDLDEDGEGQDIGRTHFPVTPRSFEEVPSPDGEDPTKVPPKPVEMDDEPKLVAWVPADPERDENWGAGEALAPMHSWVEWNVQARADEVGHDHYESLCKSHDCEKVGEYQTKQKPPEKNEESGSVKRKGKQQFEEGKYGGDNFHV